MKAVVAAFNQEKALVGAFSVIVQTVVEPMDRFTALLFIQAAACPLVWPVDGAHEGDHGEHGGHPQPHPGRGRAAGEVEAHPGHRHDQAARHVHLDTQMEHLKYF